MAQVHFCGATRGKQHAVQKTAPTNTRHLVTAGADLFWHIHFLPTNTHAQNKKKEAIIPQTRRNEGTVNVCNGHLLLLLSPVTSLSGPVTACGSSSSESCSRAAATLRSSALSTLNVEHALTCFENNKNNIYTDNTCSKVNLQF